LVKWRTSDGKNFKTIGNIKGVFDSFAFHAFSKKILCFWIYVLKKLNVLKLMFQAEDDSFT